MSRETRIALAIAAAIVVLALGGMGALLVARVVSSPTGLLTDSSGPHSGWQATWAGDADADGTPDVVLTTPYEPTELGIGRTRVFSGAPRQCLRTFSHDDRRFASWNRPIYAGDVNGDGRDDVYVRRGDASVIFDVASGAELRRLRADSPSDYCALDDIDGDGVDDLLVYVAEPRNEGGYTSVTALSGATGAQIWELEGRLDVSGEKPRSFGSYRCVVGDVSGDGIVDVAIGNKDGSPTVVSGRDGTPIKKLGFELGSLGALECAGDLDGDRMPDLLVRNSFNARVRAISYATGAELWSVPCERYERLEASATCDFDGDGVGDIAVSGRETWIHSGANGGRIERLDAHFCGAADFDLDGRADLLVVHNVGGEVAEELGDAFWRAGRVEVLSGRDRSVLFELDGDDLTPIKR